MKLQVVNNTVLNTMPNDRKQYNALRYQKIKLTKLWKCKFTIMLNEMLVCHAEWTLWKGWKHQRFIIMEESFI